MTKHREVIKEWLKTIILRDQFVVDWGSGSKPVSRYTTNYDCAFVTIDKNPLIVEDRRSPIHFTHDIQEPFDIVEKGYRLCDVAFCIEVLEHVEDPRAVLENIYNNLEQGGVLYLTAPFQFEIHSDDDYWRYTENGLRLLLGWVGFIVEDVIAQDDNSGYFVRAIR